MRAWLHQMLLKWKSLGKGRQLDRDLDDELAFHLAKREQDNRAAGMNEKEARYAARRRMSRGPSVGRMQIRSSQCHKGTCTCGRLAASPGECYVF